MAIIMAQSQAVLKLSNQQNLCLRLSETMSIPQHNLSFNEVSLNGAYAPFCIFKIDILMTALFKVCQMPASVAERLSASNTYWAGV